MIDPALPATIQHWSRWITDIYLAAVLLLIGRLYRVRDRIADRASLRLSVHNPFRNLRAAIWMFGPGYKSARDLPLTILMYAARLLLFLSVTLEVAGLYLSHSLHHR
jgi:hypothetical protein